MRYRLLLPAAVLLPLCSHAQTAPTPRPRFYVGLSAASSSVKSPDGFTGNPTLPATHNNLPLLPQLTAGWQLAPRLALQLGLRYAQQRDTYSFVQQQATATGQPYLSPGYFAFQLRSVAVPVLLRYTLTRNATRRLQVDALGGVTLLRRDTRYRSLYAYATSDSAQAPAPVTSGAYRRLTTDVNATLGLGARYRVAQRLEVTGNVLANYQLTNHVPPAVGIAAPATSPRLAVTGSLGVNYLFGLH